MGTVDFIYYYLINVGKLGINKLDRGASQSENELEDRSSIDYFSQLLITQTRTRDPRNIEYVDRYPAPLPPSDRRFLLNYLHSMLVQPERYHENVRSLTLRAMIAKWGASSDAHQNNIGEFFDCGWRHKALVHLELQVLHRNCLCHSQNH
jgi:hypothetical protein